MIMMVRALREELQMSREQLASRAHVSPRTIANVERGRPVRMDTERGILLALGRSVDDKSVAFPQ